MSSAVKTDTDGLCHVQRDASWGADVRREILQGIADAEKGAALANLVCWIIVALAAATLPNADHYIAPLILRVAAMFTTKMSFGALRRRLTAKRRLGPALNWMLLSLFFGGFAWGATMVPVVVEPFLNPGRMLVGGATIAGVSIIVSLLLPEPRFAGAYIAGFFLAYGLGLVWAPEQFAIKGAFGILGLFAIFLAYGAVTAIRHRKAAETLVENRRLGEELSEALAHAEFLAYRDPLTGLANRRAFFQHGELVDGSRARHVLAIDLDHFKRINDTFGHPVGDRVLIGVAQAMGLALRELESGDHCMARIGGEEFAIILDVADQKVAQMIAEMIRHEIALVSTQIAVEGLVTTASTGVSPWLPGERLDTVLSHADHALYRAKARGRDRIELAVRAG